VSAQNPPSAGVDPAGAMVPGTHHVAGLPLGDAALARVVTDGLERVEDLLRREVHSDYRFVTDTSLHLIDAGGKRFRPLLTLLAAQLGGAPAEGGAEGAVPDDVVTAATSVELVHLATLYHDDVMDEATMRRGAESANSRWDNTVAILTGDYLFAHASRLVSDLGPVAVRIIADTFAELVTGQMRETRGPAPGEDVVDHYLAVVAEKTGSLIATSGRFGAMFAGAPDEQVSAMSRFGELIGTAFQVSDDIIDIASPSGESGKTPGTDLREGVPTLPVLYALAGDGPEVPRLRELLGTGFGARDLADADLDEALELLRGSDGLREARRALDLQAEQARAELVALPAGPARDALAALLDYTVERTG
jgi:heptaprenyl diphosphate synthase